MTADSLKNELFNLIKQSYPNIAIKVDDEADGKRHLYFTEEKFASLFPIQRYHYLMHLIPKDFYEKHLSTAIWHELAPGEQVDELDYHDEETVESIKETILDVIQTKTTFIKQLDSLFTEEKAVCFGDFRHAKQVLSDLSFTTDEQFDIFHVFMSEGGYCDCEILYNTFKETEYSKKYWATREK
jgi:hypothetical protein